MAKEIAPHHARFEQQGRVDKARFRAAGAQGFLGFAVPVEFGGGGVDDFRYHAIITEEVSRAGCIGSGLCLSLHNDIATPYFLAYATDEQRRRWLPGIASGTLMTAIAMTEPDTGSDLAAIRTRAVRDGDRYVLNGAKTFITHGLNSDLAEMKTELDIAQVFLDDMLARHVERGLTAVEAAEVKWWTTELQHRVVDRCLQLHGGYGYTLESPIARAYCDSRGQTIYAGTTEIMKDIVGCSLGL